ncbi:MAG: HD domain-containing protein [Clostridia bacterium]|nr:HD domain-containing protein [Clostridia bacterium]
MKREKTSDYILKFVEYTKDLLNDEDVKRMKTFHHHREITTHYHSVYVTYTVLRLCERFKPENEKQIIRAALLHDFYLYEWYTEKHDENHIWYHPVQSVKNIESHFGNMSPMQRNMVMAHMFPLCREMPRSVGAWFLTIADKYCATADYLGLSRKFSPIYSEINRRSGT